MEPALAPFGRWVPPEADVLEDDKCTVPNYEYIYVQEAGWAARRQGSIGGSGVSVALHSAGSPPFMLVSLPDFHGVLWCSNKILLVSHGKGTRVGTGLELVC